MACAQAYNQHAGGSGAVDEPNHTRLDQLLRLLPPHGPVPVSELPQLCLVEVGYTAVQALQERTPAGETLAGKELPDRLAPAPADGSMRGAG